MEARRVSSLYAVILALASAAVLMTMTELRSSPSILYSDTDYSNEYDGNGGLFPLPLMKALDRNIVRVAQGSVSRVVSVPHTHHHILPGLERHGADDASGARARRVLSMNGKNPPRKPTRHLDLPSGSLDAPTLPVTKLAHGKSDHMQKEAEAQAADANGVDDTSSFSDQTSGEKARLEKEAAAADAADDADAANDHEREDASGLF
jgi:hypothetical protein